MTKTEREIAERKTVRIELGNGRVVTVDVPADFDAVDARVVEEFLVRKINQRGKS